MAAAALQHRCSILFLYSGSRNTVETVSGSTYTSAGQSRHPGLLNLNSHFMLSANTMLTIMYFQITIKVGGLQSCSKLAIFALHKKFQAVECGFIYKKEWYCGNAAFESHVSILVSRSHT